MQKMAYLPPIVDSQAIEDKRPPNFVVRALYSIFRWFGDFVPMFSALFVFIGRSLMVVINFLILLGVIIISWAHSLELLRYAGLHNGLEWVGVFVWDGSFVYSSIVLSRDFRNGTPLGGWAPWAGFLMGMCFVITSNYLGMADNYAGRVIGVATPFLLLVFKGVMAHQFRQSRKDNRRVDTNVEREMPSASTENREVEISSARHGVGDVEASSSQVEGMEKSPSMLEEVENAIPSTTTTMETGVEGEVEERVEVETPPTPIVEKKVKASTISVEDVESSPSTQVEDVEGPVEEKLPAPSKLEDVEVETSRRKVERVEKAREEEEKVEVPSSGSLSMGDQENTVSSDMERAAAMKIALHIWRTEGKPPGRRRLKEEAGCSEWIARSVAAELKKKVG